MRTTDELATELARAILARADWTPSALQSYIGSAIEDDRRALVLACCRAACEDCGQGDPQRVEEDGTTYYLHRPPGIDLLIECRSGDIRASFLER